VSSLGDGNPTEFDLGHLLIDYKLKTDLQHFMVGSTEVKVYFVIAGG